MRILWFTNNTCNYIQRGHNKTGGWMSALQDEMQKQNVELGICFCMDNQPEKREQEGTTYYPIPQHRKAFKDKIIDLWHYKDVTRDEILWPHYIAQFNKIIDDFRPDVIEVFGSELYMGLAANAARKNNIPFVLHLQGLLSLSIYILLPPGFSRWKYIWKDWNPRHVFGRFQELVYWKRSCYREKAILNACANVIGRTEWDRNALRGLNPGAIYHYGGEILRPEFYEQSERKLPSIPVIATTTSLPLYKGFDVVLKMAQILKEKYHLDFVWNVFGIVDYAFAERITGIKHDEVNVQLCGMASAPQLHEAFAKTTLYVQPSYIENSPNSVCEAQISGVPVVATNVGGTSSLVKHGETGYLFPATDPYTGAYHVKQLIEDLNLNKKMGQASKEVALARHDGDKIVKDLLATYKSIIQDAQ